MDLFFLVVAFFGGALAGVLAFVIALDRLVSDPPDWIALKSAGLDAVLTGTGILRRRMDGSLERVDPAGYAVVILDRDGAESEAGVH